MFDNIQDFLQTGLIPAIGTFAASILAFLLFFPLARLFLIATLRKTKRQRDAAQLALHKKTIELEKKLQDNAQLALANKKIEELAQFFDSIQKRLNAIEGNICTITQETIELKCDQQNLVLRSDEQALAIHVIKDNTLTQLDAMRLAWTNKVEGVGDVLSNVNNVKRLEECYSEIECLKRKIREFHAGIAEGVINAT